MPDNMDMDMMPELEMQPQHADLDAQQQQQRQQRQQQRQQQQQQAAEEGDLGMLLAPEDIVMDQQQVDDVFTPPAPPTPPPTGLEVRPTAQGQVEPRQTATTSCMHSARAASMIPAARHGFPKCQLETACGHGCRRKQIQERLLGSMGSSSLCRAAQIRRVDLKSSLLQPKCANAGACIRHSVIGNPHVL